MKTTNTSVAVILGVALVAGLALLGHQLAEAIRDFRAAERTVVVKGLAEREVAADIVIWPIQFSATSNELMEVYQELERQLSSIREHLVGRQIRSGDLSLSIPAITDKYAQSYGNTIDFRFSGLQTLTVYSADVDTVRQAMTSMAELGRQGVVLLGDQYQNLTEYQFTRLNDIKPSMIEEATRNAREVAERFAADSGSQLGRIRRASQGQFSISPRDQNNPHIKLVRVVSTIEYQLVD